MTQQALMQDFANWTEALQSVCGRFQSWLAPEHSLFIGEILHHDIGGFEYTTISTNAGRIACERPPGDQVDDRTCFLIVQEAGHSVLRHQGEAVELRPGDMALMCPEFDCDILPCGLIRHTSFHLDRQALGRRLAGGDPRFGKLPTSGLTTLLLRSLVSQVTHLDAQAATPEEGAALSEALHALLIPALDQRRDLPLESNDHQALSGLKRNALAMIETSLGQPLLSPNWLAQELGVSVRNLYRAFEEGDSICQSIMRARLERSAADLSSPMLQRASITDIAYRWGFTDSAHFSRAFRKRFACTPKDYRRQAIRG